MPIIMDLCDLPTQIPQLVKAEMSEEVVFFLQLERLRSSCPWVHVKDTKEYYCAIFLPLRNWQLLKDSG